MKSYCICILLFLISINAAGQKVEYISHYFKRYDESEKMNYFKIGPHRLKFGKDAVYLNDNVLLEKDTSSFFFLEVYSGKILIVSYYPMSQAHVSTGPGFRPKQKVEFILLSDPSQKWYFDLKGAFNSDCIVNFDEKTGELELRRTIKGKRTREPD